MHLNRVAFLKIYLFTDRTDMFRLFPSHHQSACYMVQLCFINFKNRYTVAVHLLVTFSPISYLIMQGVRHIKQKNLILWRHMPRRYA
jgi:hypothetical protein